VVAVRRAAYLRKKDAIPFGECAKFVGWVHWLVSTVYREP
jgi:hypothetical protein